CHHRLHEISENLDNALEELRARNIVLTLTGDIHKSQHNIDEINNIKCISSGALMANRSEREAGIDYIPRQFNIYDVDLGTGILYYSTYWKADVWEEMFQNTVKLPFGSKDLFLEDFNFSNLTNVFKLNPRILERLKNIISKGGKYHTLKEKDEDSIFSYNTFVKKVVITGFKSFGEKTVEIAFSKGLNCITGVKDSGKSNIIEAILFGLGVIPKMDKEKKILNSYIFKTNSDNIQLKKAKVELYLDNSTKIFRSNKECIKIERVIVEDGGSNFLKC
ncbi:unnamed protein product, partial [marine sediment metagenome]